MRLGGAQDKDHPFRRLFERLQKRVKRLARDLMGLVDDEDFIAVARGTEADAFPQLAHFIDAAVGGGVDLDHIDGRARGDFRAARADSARRGRRSLDAIQTARKNAGDCRLSGPALPREDIAVGDPPLGDGVFEGGFNVFLADQLAKYLGAILAGDDLVHCGAFVRWRTMQARGAYARPRVIRGTRVKPLPLLPSGPGGVCSHTLHEARSLTTPYASKCRLRTLTFGRNLARRNLVRNVSGSDGAAKCGGVSSLTSNSPLLS